MKLIRPWRNKIFDLEEITQKEKEYIDEVLPCENLTSEEVHGGMSATKDIQNSPNPADDGSQEQESKPYRKRVIEIKAEEEKEGKEGSEKDTQDNQSGEGAKEEQNAESFKANTQDKNSEGSKEEQNSEGSKEDTQNNNAEGSEEEGEDEQEGEEEGENGDLNRDSLYEDRPVLLGFLQVHFAKLISRLAEDGYLWTDGDELWDFSKLAKRKFFAKPLRACRKERKKERIVLALDFSGSCYHLSEFFLKLAKIALKFKEVEVLDASNGFGEENKRIGEEGIVRFEELAGRKVLFFGDFDGGASLVELSRIAKVWWFSCEGRYEDLSEHDWCLGYTLKDFKGVYLECKSEQDLIKILKNSTKLLK